MSTGERVDGRGVKERFVGKHVTFPYAIINEELYVGLWGGGNGNLLGSKVYYQMQILSLQ